MPALSKGRTAPWGTHRECPHRTAHDQDADAPPSTGSTWPLTCLEASLARKTTAPFKSSLLPSRRSGVRAMTASPMSSSRPADIFDGKKPGQIALTLMPYGPTRRRGCG